MCCPVNYRNFSLSLFKCFYTHTHTHTHTHTQMKTPFVLGTTAVNFLFSFLPLSLLACPPLSVILSPGMVIGQFSVIVRSGAIKPLLGVETPAAFCLILENTAIGTPTVFPPCRHLQQQH